MAQWIADGRVQEFILLLTVFEFAALFALRRGFAMIMLPNILAGDFLLLAWLSSIGRCSWIFAAAALLAAFCAHLTDLARRWR
jgi:hypothetical protein